MVFLLPASPAHAATPTVSLSTISSGAKTAATSGTVGSTLVITGTGFGPDAAVTITTAVGATTVPWLASATCGVTNGGVSSTTIPVDSLVDNSGGTNNGCLITDSKGSFQVEVAVPALPGGAQTITTSDGTNTVTSTFIISSSITITYTGNHFGFPEQAVSAAIAVAGFGASEVVTVSTPMWVSTSTTCNTDTMGSASCSASTSVADTTGGTKTITATGGTSGLSATTTFTVNPWAAFYNSVGGTTTFSFAGNAPTSLIVEAHGLASGTISANSITLAGVATNHASVTVGTSGYFTGLVISPAANVPFGQASVVIQGNTFNYALGNIALTNGVWGGALISSIVGSSSSTGVMSTDAASYKPGTVTASTTNPAPAQNQIGFFGYGFVPVSTCGGASGGAISVTNGGAALTGPTFYAGNGGVGGGSSVAQPDCNGALFATATLGDTAYSTSATPTSATSYNPIFTQVSVAPANILSPTFGITPWTTAPSATSVDFATAITVTGHGFSDTETLTLKVGGTAATGAGATCTASAGTCSMTGTVPDIAGGSQSVTVTGTSSGQVGTSATPVTVMAIASSNGAGTILPNNGYAGTTAVIRTGSTYGIHGLAANTAYNIVWNGIGGAETIGSFTSTATGGIPVPGVQFSVPGDSSGIHIVDIETMAGASVFFGSTVLGDVTPSVASYGMTAYGDMLFSNTATLQTSPSVAAIGAPESISGNGLSAGVQYIVTLSSTNACPTTSQVTQPALGAFTSTSTGAVPSGTAITLTDTATNTETGTVEYFVIQTASTFGVVGGAVAACAQFVLSASAALSASSAASGQAVTLTAHGLNNGGVYNVVFNYALNALGNGYTGTTVGVVAASSTGAGTVTWNVPSGTQPGTYTVQLVLSTPGVGGTLTAGTAVLNLPLTITVGAPSGNCANEGTSCMAISGTPTVTKSGGNTLITASFTNNSNAPQTAYIYGVVHNALGQTVYYTTGTVSPAAGSSQSTQLVLFGLPTGTYSVTLFAVSTSGTAISTTTSVSVTV